MNNNIVQKIHAIKITEKIQDLQNDEHYFYVLNKQNSIRFNKYNTKPNQSKSLIYLEKFWVNNEDFTTKNKLNLRYNQNDIRLQVAMIDFAKTNSIYYRINN